MTGGERIARGKVAIAAHHYQRPEIVARAGLVGDSYRLAVEAAETDAEFIVMCGVRFMAESAAILARPGQTVVIPDMNALCPMADMIDRALAEDALTALESRAGRRIIPITYMNSHADLKALTGERFGAICTSGNARKVLAHFLDAGESVLFMPDFNLGFNTARELALPSDALRLVTKDLAIRRIDRSGTVVKNTAASSDGAGDDLSGARVFLWDGFCHVHRAFTAADVFAARDRFPGAKIMVHPECVPEVVALADSSGSTEAMSRALRDASAASSWVIGTEGRFVERMAATFPEKTIVPLRVSYCHNMNKIDEQSLDRTLSLIAAQTSIVSAAQPKIGSASGKAPIPGTVSVIERDRENAARALRAMVAIAEKGA